MLINNNHIRFTGGSKKRAKADAAKHALIGIIGPDLYASLVLAAPHCVVNKPNVRMLPQIVPQVESELNKDFFNEDPNVTEYDFTFSDYISR